MKKHVMLLAAIAGSALLLAGCSSVEVSSPQTRNGYQYTEAPANATHITATTEGWYLLWIPILTGSADKPGTMVFNQDTCNVASATRMVTAKAKSTGAQSTINLVSTRSSGLAFPIPFLFRWKTAQVSGNAVR